MDNETRLKFIELAKDNIKSALFFIEQIDGKAASDLFEFSKNIFKCFESNEKCECVQQETIFDFLRKKINKKD